MDPSNGKAKKGLIIKTWERCKSMGGGSTRGNKRSSLNRSMIKTKSCPHLVSSPDAEEKQARKHRVVPEGCFSVYVGPDRQRFVVKIEHANHPLFKMLLEEAESEYGYNSAGPLSLPCNVDIFSKVLNEMDYDVDIHRSPACGLARGHSAYRLLSPSRLIALY